MHLRKYCFAATTLLVFIAAGSAVATQQSRSKEERIRELLRLTGAADMGKQVMDQMLESLRRMPNLPEGFIDRFKREARPDELIELIVPIYDRNLDEALLDSVIAFYKTPAGQKFVQVQPKIAQESMAAGQKWGEKLGRQIAEDLEKATKKP